MLELLYPRLVRERWSPGTGIVIEPALAEAWTFSADRRELTFHLREARWSDGRSVDCADVEFTWRAQHAAALGWPGIYLKEAIEDFHCADRRTAVFRFSRPSAYQLLDANDDAQVSRAYGDLPFGKWLETAWEERMVSAGPFRLERVVPGQEAILVRDPTWWEAGRPYLERLVFRVYAGADEALRALLAGEVDLLEKVPPARAAEVAAREDLALLDLPGLSWSFIAWNQLEPDAYGEDRRRRGCETGCSEDAGTIRALLERRPHPILSDPRVRRALTAAIDRQDLVDGPWHGHARVAVSPLVSFLGLPGQAEALPWDPVRAAAWLEEAGWKLPAGGGVRQKGGRRLELEILVNADNTLRREVLERVVTNLDAVGVAVRPVALPRREFVARARAKDFDGLLGGWRAGTRIEPQSILHCDAAAGRGNNLGAWCDAEADALAEQAAAASDLEHALPVWRRWEARFIEQQPYTMLYEERVLIGLSRRVHDATPSPLHPYAGIENWWVDPPVRSAASAAAR
ncbi:MAG: ABC transporter substrate-binding protein [Acidobacteriota bacterium]|nr:ABC transporter substrate-binding protein [Acidobacteriota bacterium]